GIVVVRTVPDPLTKAGRAGRPSQYRLAPLTKLLPLTVSVKVSPPFAAARGTVLVMCGAGLLTVKVSGVESPPPGAPLSTATVKKPAVCSFSAGTVAVMDVLFTKPAVSAAP